MNGYLRWWQRVVGFGLLVNFVSGLAALVMPQQVQRALRLEPLAGTAWLRLAGLMLVNVSIYGLGTLRDPAKHPLNAQLASWERLGSGLFSLQVALRNPLQSATRPKAFLPLGLFDTTVSIAGIVLLHLGFRKQRQERAR